MSQLAVCHVSLSDRLTRYTYLDKDGNIQEADADLTRKRPIGSRRGTPDGGPPRISPSFHRPRTPALEWSWGELAPMVTGTGSGEACTGFCCLPPPSIACHPSTIPI